MTSEREISSTNGNLAELAWAAYRKSVGGTAHNGNQLPETLYDLGERQTLGWIAAVEAVADNLLGDLKKELAGE